MSRIGKHEVVIPSSIKVEQNGRNFEFSAKGITSSFFVDDSVLVEKTNTGIKVRPANNSQFSRSMWGTTQKNLWNIVRGLDKGFSTTLDLVGVGYRASVNGRVLTMQLGMSHDIVYSIPEGIEVKCEKPTIVIVSGHNKQQVNQVCALLRGYRPPEPYKGKGVIRSGEYVVRKEGKKK